MSKDGKRVNWSDEGVCLCFLVLVGLMRLKMTKELRSDLFLITAKTWERLCKQVACCLSNQ